MSRKTDSSDLADFFQQLALLVRSNLPLPECLRQLGGHFTRKSFRSAIQDISRRVARGEEFSDALEAYPGLFRRLHIRLIKAGEASGTLPETLLSIARYARFCDLVTSRMRDILAYPLATVHIAIVVGLFMSIKVIPVFHETVVELVGGAERIPLVSNFIVSLGMFINSNRVPFFAAYVLFLAFSIWIFTPGLNPHRVMMAIINRMPGTCRIVNSLDSARLCSVLSILLREKTPLHEALASVGELMERQRIRKALDQASARSREGADAAQIISREPAIDNLIGLTLRTTPEKELPCELARLAEVFDHRVTLSVKFASTVWSILSFLGVTVIVGLVVISLFQPLISILSAMAI
jgi:type II secretory pathway component PulF